MFIPDGFSATVAFSLLAFPAIFIREREVTPFEIDQGGPIDTVTMRNILLRTTAAKSLTGVNALKVTANYDPFFYSQLLIGPPRLIGATQLVTVTFPDAATVAVWCFIDKYTPNGLKEGDFPLADLVVVPTLRNTAGTETLPVIAGGASLGLVIR